MCAAPDGSRRVGRAGRRTGFTVYELLVVVSVAALLAALLLPAILSSRASAREMSCKNNLRQMTLALANYEQTFATYPPIEVFGPSPHLALLPFLDQQPLADDLNANRINGEAAMLVPVFRCRDDVRQLTAEIWPTSYGYNAGAGMLTGPDGLGPFAFGGQKARSIRDGFSTTAAFTEIDAGGGELGTVYQVPLDAYETPAPEAAEACLKLDTDGAPVASLVRGINWVMNDGFSISYNHMLPPLTRSCVLSLPRAPARTYTGSNASLNAAGSHAGFVNVGFLDGSVRAVTSGVDTAVWRGAGSVSGGEIVPDDFK